MIALSQAPGPLRAQPAADKMVADIGLAAPFHAQSDWRFLALQAPDGPDPNFPHETAPGRVHFCLQKARGAACVNKLDAMPPETVKDGWDAHYLDFARLVRPPELPTLLLVRTRSDHSGDGGQAVYTQLYEYRPATDSFVRVYGHVTGTNNNEEDRYVASGPLAGSLISAEPTTDSPYRFWVTVSEMTSGSPYRQVLRYRSATGYNDGNTLAVIDSEMPNIEQRLGIWRTGDRLPLPAKCAKPRLKHMELWCRDAQSSSPSVTKVSDSITH